MVSIQRIVLFICITKTMYNAYNNPSCYIYPFYFSDFEPLYVDWIVSLPVFQVAISFWRSTQIL